LPMRGADDCKQYPHPAQCEHFPLPPTGSMGPNQGGREVLKCYVRATYVTRTLGPVGHRAVFTRNHDRDCELGRFDTLIAVSLRCQPGRR
jgi:hypothetical protein